MLVGTTIASNDLKTDASAELKAYFIYSFTKYIEWSGMDRDSVFTIAVLGESDLIAPLKTIALKKRVADLPINIVEWSSSDQIGSCHILFIADSMTDQLSLIMKQIEDKQILSIGDSPGLARKGVFLNFIPAGERIGFEINSTTMDHSRLKISYQLLKLAKIVN